MKKNVSNTCPINSKFFFKARNLLHYPSGNYFNDALLCSSSRKKEAFCKVESIFHDKILNRVA